MAVEGNCLGKSLKERIFAKRKSRLKQLDDEKEPEREDIKNEVNSPDDSWWSSYGIDLFKTLRGQENAWPNMVLRSPQLDYRATLVNIIRSSAKSIEASEATVFLAVRYLDRFMMDHDIKPYILSYVAITALLMAAKVDDSREVFKKCAKLRLNEYAFDGDSLKLEYQMCYILRWRLSTPTILSFAKVAARSSINKEGYRIVLDQFLDVALKDKHLSIILRPSVVGVACVYATCHMLKLGKESDDYLTRQVLDDEASKQSVINAVDRLLKLREIVTNKLKRKVDEPGVRSEFIKINLNAPQQSTSNLRFLD